MPLRPWLQPGLSRHGSAAHGPQVQTPSRMSRLLLKISQGKRLVGQRPTFVCRRTRHVYEKWQRSSVKLRHPGTLTLAAGSGHDILLKSERPMCLQGAVVHLRRGVECSQVREHYSLKDPCACVEWMVQISVREASPQCNFALCLRQTYPSVATRTSRTCWVNIVGTLPNGSASTSVFFKGALRSYVLLWPGERRKGSAFGDRKCPGSLRISEGALSR